MKSKILTQSTGERIYILVFETGDEVMKSLKDFAQTNKLSGSSFTAIGAFSKLTVGYFNWEKKEYKKIEINEQVEVLSLIGDVSLKEDGSRQLHAHVVVGKSDGTAHGGHLLEAYVRPTLELVLTETSQALQRKYDPESGIALINIKEYNF